jgi:hypothetical protein
MSKIRIAIVLSAAALAIGGAVACGGGATPAPTVSVTTANTTKPPTTQPTQPSPAQSTTDPSDGGGNVAKPISAEQKNANEAAADYLDGQAFSRKGLINQLKFEGYSTKQATTAVDTLNADWNEQAVLVAKDYLDGQTFSRKSLLEQLKFDGFTPTQAAYGVKHSGL